MNTVTLIGYLGNDPELRQTKSGKSVTGFRLATNFTWPSSEKALQQRTDWHNIVCWNEQAESVCAVLHKGSQVMVEGSLRTRSYQKVHKAKNGKTSVKVTHFMTEIVARDVRMLGVQLSNGKDHAVSAAA